LNGVHNLLGMTAADQEVPTGDLESAQAPQPAAQPRPGRARWWLWVIPLAAIVGLGLGLAAGALAPGLGSAPTGGVSARPTVVFATGATPPSFTPDPVATDQPPPGEVDAYTVEPGDSLRSIAARVYGDPDRWSQIYEANRESIGPDPDSLRVGVRLRLPPD
jgi:LysM domain